MASGLVFRPRRPVCIRPLISRRSSVRLRAGTLTLPFRELPVPLVAELNRDVSSPSIHYHHEIRWNENYA